MGTTEFKAYARRRKVKKEGLGEKTPILQNQPEECVDLKREHCSTDDESANRLLSLELDVAEALADFWRMAHRPPQQPKFLQWSCKRKRTPTSLTKDAVAPSMQLKEEPEDALSTVKKIRTSWSIGRDSSTSDRDDIESMPFSKESSSLLDSRAQSPSSPLPSLQLPRDVKSAFQRVLPLAPGLLTVKTEMEDVHSGHLAMVPQQVSARPKSKPCKSVGSKAAIKAEFGAEHCAACPEEGGVKSELYEVAGSISLNKTKSALSEKEKEARKLRRIQANRESARQTIRKKQVLCEDLTKKASNLASENEGMKQQRDALMQELFNLKAHNYHLKQQLERRSLGSFGHESPANMSLDSASAPALPYAGGPPPPAFVWAMAAAAAAAAAAANQAYTFNKQETWDATSPLQHQKAAFLPSLPSCKQTSVSEALTQSMNRPCAGESFMPVAETPHKERDSRDSSVGMCVQSSASEAHRDNSAHKATHPATGDLSGKAPCDFSLQAGCPPLTQCIVGPQTAQGAACGLSYGGSGAGYFKGNLQVHAMNGRSHHAAMVAAEARRRRKELTRNKFARSRAIRAAAVS